MNLYNVTIPVKASEEVPFVERMNDAIQRITTLIPLSSPPLPTTHTHTPLVLVIYLNILRIKRSVV